MRIIIWLLLALNLNVYSQTHFCSSGKQKTYFTNFGKSATLSQQELMNQYDVKYHHLDLQIERDTTYIKGNVRTVATVIASQLDTFGFELHSNFTIDSVEGINGNNLQVIRVQHVAFVLMPASIMQNAQIDLRIYYHGTAPKSASAAIGNGFSSGNSTRWGNRATWSLSQPYSAYEWWPCKQSLQDKIDSTLTYITTSNENKAGSQGKLIGTINLPNNKIRYEWKSQYPVDYYLISVTAAKYIEYNTYALVDGDSILIQDYIYDNPQTLITFKPVLDQTANMIEAFSKHLGKYPFSKEKYGHAMAPFSGGMEHQTMTSIGVIDFGIVAHELGHQWFGDHITCETWQDIWLNEGFASYTEYLALEWLSPSEAPAHMRDVHSIVMSSPNGSIWFTDTTNVGRIFDGRLTYNKGSAFIHTLRYEINNDSVFFGFLKTYYNQFSFKTATTIEFKNLLEQYSGKDFTQVFNQWFYGEGYPKFVIKWYQQNDTLYMQAKENTSTPITGLFVTPVDYRIIKNGPDPDMVIRLNQASNLEYYKIPITGTVASIEVDPNNYILNEADVTQDITVLGMQEQKLVYPKIEVFPNPVKQELTILGMDKEQIQYVVYDVFGRKCLAGSGNTIQVSNLQSGMYLVTLIGKEGSIFATKNFIKE